MKNSVLSRLHFKTGRKAGEATTPVPARVLMLVLLVYFFIPLIWLLISITKNNPDLFVTFGFAFADDFSLFSNIVDTLTLGDGIYVRWIINTVFYAGVSAVVSTIIAAAAGYAISQLSFPGSRLYQTVVLCTIMVPATALTIPTYILLSQAGLTNTPWAVILPHCVTPFGFYLMAVYSRSAIPDGLLEAARVDGAGEYRIFWTIALPQLTPGLVTVLILNLVGTWNDYFLPLIMLSDTNLYPVTVGLSSWNYQAAGGDPAGAIFSNVLTGSALAVLPLIIAFLTLQRYWESGITLGSVKS
jgi:multiple sugar transport system permease protein